MAPTKTKTKRQAKPKLDVYAAVTDKVIEALEAGTVPWRKPWDPTVGQPVSLSTEKPYNGINVLLLGLEAQIKGYESPFWGTYKAIKDRGGQVRKDEKGTLITFWKRITTQKLDEATGQYKPKTFMMLKYFKIFNSDQADAIPAGTDLPDNSVADGVFKLPEMKGVMFDPIEQAEEIFQGYFTREGSPKLVVGQDGRAWYSPSSDMVSLPPREAFHSAEAFYSTAFHEATHSTGHSSRLKREGVLEGHPFGSDMYAREELVAEMGAAMLAGVAGIENTIPMSAAYIENWMGAIRKDPKLVMQAASKAQKAADLVIGAEVALEATDASPEATEAPEMILAAAA